MPSTIGKCKLFRIKLITLLEGAIILRNKHDIAFFEIKCTFFGRKENTIIVHVGVILLQNCYIFIILKQTFLDMRWRFKTLSFCSASLFTIPYFHESFPKICSVLYTQTLTNSVCELCSVRYIRVCIHVHKHFIRNQQFCSLLYWMCLRSLPTTCSTVYKRCVL